MPQEHNCPLHSKLSGLTGVAPAMPCPQYGHWDAERFQQLQNEYTALLTAQGREWGKPRTDEEFLHTYYFLRKNTQASELPARHGTAGELAPLQQRAGAGQPRACHSVRAWRASL
jgi:hypothetical protein